MGLYHLTTKLKICLKYFFVLEMRRNQAQIDRVVLYQNRAQFVLNLGKLVLFIYLLWHVLGTKSLLPSWLY